MNSIQNVRSSEIHVRLKRGQLFSGGTFQCRNTSPDAQWECEGSDVGGVRRRHKGQPLWETMPTSGHDADRKVAGAVILNDGTMFTLVGNATKAGRILEYALDGSVSLLADGLHVRANSLTTGDSDRRPRPVGWMLHFDPVAKIVYACTGDGLYRHFIDNPGASGLIELKGESLRGFVHEDATTVGEASELTVCTRTQGVVRIKGLNRDTDSLSVKQLGSLVRVEDGAFTPEGNILAACHYQGLYRINTVEGKHVDITPFEVIDPQGYNSIGANGGKVSWTAVDVHPDTGIGLATMINPVHAHSWVYRSTVPIDLATSADWESITHRQITLENGAGYVQPKARTPGGSAKNGAGLTGGQHISYIRSDRTGNTIKTLNTLVTGLTKNATAADHSTVVWKTDVAGSSLLSMLDVAVSAAGVLGIAVSDHNAFVSPDILTATSTEPKRIGVPGLGDAYAIDVVNETWVFAPCEDHDWQDPDNGLRYFNGAGEPTTWASVGWDTYEWNKAADYPAGLPALPAGIPPRPVSACGHDNGDGTIRFFVMADGIGFVYQDYSPRTDKWGDPQISQGGPTNDEIISKSQNTTRSSKCKTDGSIVLHQLQKTGHIYRSLDRGATVQRIATGSNGPEIAAAPAIRTGYMQLNEAGNCAVVSNRNGVYVIRDLTDADPEVVQLTADEHGPIAINQATGSTFIHLRGGGAARLLMFDDIVNATSLQDGLDIASTEYATHLGDQANQMLAVNYNDKPYLITLYQGGGFAVSEVHG